MSKRHISKHLLDSSLYRIRILLNCNMAIIKNGSLNDSKKLKFAELKKEVNAAKEKLQYP